MAQFGGRSTAEITRRRVPRTTSKRGCLDELHSNAEKSERNLTAVCINAIPLQSKLNCNRTEFALYGSRIGWGISQFKRNSEFNYLECNSNAVGLLRVVRHDPMSCNIKHLEIWGRGLFLGFSPPVDAFRLVYRPSA